MNWKEECDTGAARSAFCAGAAPVAHTAAGCPWWLTLLLAMLAGTMHYCACRRKVPAFVGGLRELCNTLAAVTILDWMTGYWTDLPDYAIVIAALLFALWVGCASDGASQRAWGVAFYFVAALLLTVMLSGLADVKLQNLQPELEVNRGWTAALGILLAFRFGCSAGSYTLAPVTSFVSLGVLGTAGVVPLYELSRCIRYLGVAPRFESLCACAVTMSFLIGLGELLGKTERQASRNWMLVIKAVWSLSLWYLGVRIPHSILCLGLFLLWVIPDLLGSRIVLSRPSERTGKNFHEKG